MRNAEFEMLVNMIRHYRGLLLDPSVRPLAALKEINAIVGLYDIPCDILRAIDDRIIELYTARIDGRPIPVLRPIHTVTGFENGEMMIFRNVA